MNISAEFPDGNIILTGFMATGKTTVARHIARLAGRQFVDTDAEIVRRQGMEIGEIFSTLGEPAFRRMEADLALALAGKNRQVIATGGRMMLDPANREVLEKSGVVFCLSAPPEVIMARVQADRENIRPLLAEDGGLDRLLELMAERRKGYARFVQVDTTEKTPEAVAEEIMALYGGFSLP